MAKSKEEASKDTGIKILVENRKARFDYHIIETFEAGMVLTGHEIKSIRNGGANLQEAYVRASNGEIYLIGAHITPYSFTKHEEIDPVRPRKLLMHKAEIMKIQGRTTQKGFTVVPLEIYLKRGLAKLKIGLAKGKSSPDKRNTIKDREAKRDIARAMRKK